MEDLTINIIEYTEILNNDSKFILTSYYWGTNNINKGSIYKLTYDEQVRRLINDCRKAKVNYYFVNCLELSKPGKNYQESIGLKPTFIEIVMNKFKNYTCVYVDTDLRLLKYPNLFDIDADCFFTNAFEFGYTCYNPLQVELSGGIMAFGNTFNGRQVLKLLKEKLDIKYVEDKTFSGIITRNFLNIHTRCIWLPSTYLYMFSKHTYDTDYTNIVSYKEELKGSFYKKSDLVFAHEDFETESLQNIFNDRVKHDRYPPNVNKELSEKLRCYNSIKFIYYKNWNLTNKQENQYNIDINYKSDIKLITIKKIQKYEPQKFEIINKKTYNTNYRIVFIINTDTSIDMFENKCYINKVSFTIIKCNKNVKHSLILYKLMKNSSDNLVYITNEKMFNFDKYKLYNIKSMDFMVYNMNNDKTCFDPRILKLLNTPIYFNNNDTVLKFLLIWGEHTKREYNNAQYMALEYAFNISNALNKMRCYWTKPPIHNLKRKFFDKNDVLLKKLQQCGLKPTRKSQIDYYTKTHFKGSKNSTEKLKYSKIFLVI